MDLNYHNAVYIFHILIIGPLLVYLGYANIKNIKVSPRVYEIIIVLGIATALYHGYLAFLR